MSGGEDAGADDYAAAREKIASYSSGSDSDDDSSSSGSDTINYGGGDVTREERDVLGGYNGSGDTDSGGSDSGSTGDGGSSTGGSGDTSGSSGADQDTINHGGGEVTREERDILGGYNGGSQTDGDFAGDSPSSDDYGQYAGDPTLGGGANPLEPGESVGDIGQGIENDPADRNGGITPGDAQRARELERQVAERTGLGREDIAVTEDFGVELTPQGRLRRGASALEEEYGVDVSPTEVVVSDGQVRLNERGQAAVRDRLGVPDPQRGQKQTNQPGRTQADESPMAGAAAGGAAGSEPNVDGVPQIDDVPTRTIGAAGPMGITVPASADPRTDISPTAQSAIDYAQQSYGEFVGNVRVEEGSGTFEGPVDVPAGAPGAGVPSGQGQSPWQDFVGLSTSFADAVSRPADAPGAGVPSGQGQSAREDFDRAVEVATDVGREVGEAVSRPADAPGAGVPSGEGQTPQQDFTALIEGIGRLGGGSTTVGAFTGGTIAGGLVDPSRREETVASIKESTPTGDVGAATRETVRDALEAGAVPTGRSSQVAVPEGAPGAGVQPGGATAEQRERFVSDIEASWNAEPTREPNVAADRPSVVGAAGPLGVGVPSDADPRTRAVSPTTQAAIDYAQSSYEDFVSNVQVERGSGTFEGPVSVSDEAPGAGVPDQYASAEQQREDFEAVAASVGTITDLDPGQAPDQVEGQQELYSGGEATEPDIVVSEEIGDIVVTEEEAEGNRDDPDQYGDWDPVVAGIEIEETAENASREFREVTDSLATGATAAAGLEEGSFADTAAETTLRTLPEIVNPGGIAKDLIEIGELGDYVADDPANRLPEVTAAGRQRAGALADYYGDNPAEAAGTVAAIGLQLPLSYAALRGVSSVSRTGGRALDVAWNTPERVARRLVKQDGPAPLSEARSLVGEAVESTRLTESEIAVNRRDYGLTPRSMLRDDVELYDFWPGVRGTQRRVSDRLAQPSRGQLNLVDAVPGSETEVDVDTDLPTEIAGTDPTDVSPGRYLFEEPREVETDVGEGYSYYEQERRQRQRQAEELSVTGEGDTPGPANEELSRLLQAEAATVGMGSGTQAGARGEIRTGQQTFSMADAAPLALTGLGFDSRTDLGAGIDLGVDQETETRQETETDLRGETETDTRIRIESEQERESEPEPEPETGLELEQEWRPLDERKRRDQRRGEQDSQPDSDTDFVAGDAFGAGWVNQYATALAGGTIEERQAPSDIENLVSGTGGVLPAPTRGQVDPDEALAENLNAVESFFFQGDGGESSKNSDSSGANPWEDLL